MEDEQLPPLLFDLRICSDFLQLKILEKMGPKTRFAIYLLCEEMRDKVLRGNYPRNQYNIVVKAHRSHYDYVSLNLYDKNGDQVFTVPITSHEVGVHLDFGVRNERIINEVQYDIFGVEGGVLLRSEKTQEETLNCFLEVFKKLYNSDNVSIQYCMLWHPFDSNLTGYVPYTEHYFGIIRQQAENWEIDYHQFINGPRNFASVQEVFSNSTVLTTTDDERKIFGFKRLLSRWTNTILFPALKQLKTTDVEYSLEKRAEMREGLICLPISKKITDGSEFFHVPVAADGFDTEHSWLDKVAGVTFGTPDREEYLMTIYSEDEVQNDNQN